MKLSEINQLHLEDYFWRALFGKSKHRASFFELRSNNFKGMPPPVFFLSTGRCGTNWFTSLLAKNKSVKVFHEPKPNFGIQGKVAYEIYTSNKFDLTSAEEQLLREIFLTGREQYLRYSYKTQKRFIETNNQISFLAPAIFSLFPKTKFVHLNRHPGEFVRSALRRKFYNNPDDIKRIVPVNSSPDHQAWQTYNPVQKNSWLWKETNQFIERFKSSIPDENSFYFDFSSLNLEQVGDLCSFLEVDISSTETRKLMNKPVNVQRSGSYPHYDKWENSDKADLIKLCGELASKYNYQL